MKQSRTTALILVIAAVASAGRDDAESSKGAKAAFMRIQKSAAKLRTDEATTRPAMAKLFVRDVQRGRADLTGILAEVEKAKIAKVVEKGDRALVTFYEAKSGEAVTRAVVMERTAGQWLLGSARSFVVESKALKTSRGKKPAVVKMSMRTKGGAYGRTAYSFSYVSGDMVKYKNRVDIWFCHNQDFHVKGVIADMGKTSLKNVKSIPLTAKWGRTARVEVGHAYVVRCGADDRRDFFVSFRVKRLKRSTVELEWTVLAGGFNAPASIHEPAGLSDEVQRAGSNGTDGLCGKNG
jgi:hypothetical protein